MPENKYGLCPFAQDPTDGTRMNCTPRCQLWDIAEGLCTFRVIALFLDRLVGELAAIEETLESLP